MGNTTTARRFRPSNAIRILAVVVAVLLVSAAMLQRSQSAFTGSTTYGGTGTLGSSTVSLSNTAAQTFNVSGLVPGDTVVRCVDVKYDGTAAGQIDSVRTFGADTSGGGLGQYLDIKGEIAPAGFTCANATTWTGGSWLGTMSDQFAAHGTYASGYDTGWTPQVTGETRAFRITVSLPASAPNAAQGKTATPAITWEVRTKAGTTR